MENWVEDSAWQLLDMLMYVMKMPAGKDTFNISHGENFALLFLMSNDGTTSKQISDFTGCSSARITKILNKLEEKGFITRASDDTDRRKVSVYITEQGRSYILSKLDKTVAAHKQIIEQLGRHDTEEYIRINQKLIQIAYKQNRKI